jgi:hypothetical protein
MHPQSQHHLVSSWLHDKFVFLESKRVLTPLYLALIAFNREIDLGLMRSIRVAEPSNVGISLGESFFASTTYPAWCARRAVAFGIALWTQKVTDKVFSETLSVDELNPFL